MATITNPAETVDTITFPASFHLVRYPAGAAAREGFSRMGRDRPELQRTPGLRFWRLLGTAAGDSMEMGGDLRRWALLAFWRSEEDLDAFLDASPVSARWDALGAERYDLRLATIRAHGSWARGNFSIDRAAPVRRDDPVAILTHATMRPRGVARFWRAVPGPSDAIREHPEHLASVGIADVPIVRQATFSLWRSLAGAQDYAYRGEAHKTVIDRTRAEGWYRAELFARFRILGATGTWSGRDPLEGITSPRPPAS